MTDRANLEPRINAESICRAIESDATTQKQILNEIGVAAAGKNYDRLGAVAESNGIRIPPRRNTGAKGKRPERRTSLVWNEALLRKAIAESTSKREVLRKLGLTTREARSLAEAASEYGLTLPNARNSQEHRLKVTRQRAEKYLVEGEPGSRRVNGKVLRKIAVSLGLLEDKCANCGTGPEWNGLPLTLQIDHINGVGTDNRIENLRILCPNCHAQTDNYCGKNIGISTVWRYGRAKPKMKKRRK